MQLPRIDFDSVVPQTESTLKWDSWTNNLQLNPTNEFFFQTDIISGLERMDAWVDLQHGKIVATNLPVFKTIGKTTQVIIL